MMKKAKQMFDTNLEVAVFALAGIIILESFALWKGVDGSMFGAAMAAIGVIIGWVCKTYHKK